MERPFCDSCERVRFDNCRDPFVTPCELVEEEESFQTFEHLTSICTFTNQNIRNGKTNDKHSLTVPYSVSSDIDLTVQYVFFRFCHINHTSISSLTFEENPSLAQQKY
jgi:hypothetical protein